MGRQKRGMRDELEVWKSKVLKYLKKKLRYLKLIHQEMSGSYIIQKYGSKYPDSLMTTIESRCPKNFFSNVYQSRNKEF